VFRVEQWNSVLFFLHQLWLCMPFDATPAAEAVSKTTSTSKAQRLRLQPLAGRLEAAPHPFRLVLGRQAARSEPRACHHWPLASSYHHQCTYIDTFTTVCSIMAAYTVLPPPRLLPPPPWPAPPAYTGQAPGIVGLCTKHQCPCQCVRRTIAQHSQAAKIRRRFLRPPSQNSCSSFLLYGFLIGGTTCSSTAALPHCHAAQGF
jgi:hypothetical protein